jgi:hypothetical protein
VSASALERQGSAIHGPPWRPGIGSGAVGYVVRMARPDETQGDDTQADHRARSGHTREGGGGEPVPADDPRDESVAGEDAGTAAEKSTPPTEGPAAAGALPG